jgi:RNA polymerase subunit RPABC4/transcription elongation factor Spt4
MDAVIDQVGAIIAGILDNPIVRLGTIAIVGYVVLLWLATAYWVLRDMQRRHLDPAMGFAAATAVVVASPVLFPLALVVYRIVRPGETLAERRERELTERLEEVEADFALACPGCARSVEEDWLVCPACRTRLARRCASCGRTMGLDWSLCGWCGAEFGHPILPERLPKAVRQSPVRDRVPAGVRTGGSTERAFGPGA